MPRTQIHHVWTRLQMAAVLRPAMSRSRGPDGRPWRAATLAGALGCDVSLVKGWLYGRGALTPYWIARLREVLRLDPETVTCLVLGCAVFEHARMEARGEVRPHPTATYPSV